MGQRIELNWVPDSTATIPMYQQIISYFLARIQAGDWLIGDQLPTQRQLAAQFGVNRSTISQAMTILLADGVLTTDHGAGTRIASNSWSVMMAHDPMNWQDYISSGEFVANQPVIQRINDLEGRGDLIRMSTGELGPDLYPKAFIQRAMRQAAGQLTNLNYLPPLGLQALREALVQRLSKWGIVTTPDNVLITSGSLQSLQLIAVSLLEKGATVYTTPASYLKSLRVLQSVNAQFSELPVDDNGPQYWHIKPTTHQRLLYTIPTFDNPGGTVMDGQRRQDLLQFAKTHQLPIIEDTAYQDIWLDERPPQPLKANDIAGNVLYLGSISKSLAPGMRLGWLVGSSAIIKRLADVKMQTDYGASSLSQQVLTAIFADADYESYLAKMRAAIRVRRDNAQRELERQLGDVATWNRPSGGFYIWVTLAPEISVTKLFNDAVEAGVLLNPGVVYDSHATQQIRLSYGYETSERFSEGLTIIAELIHQQLR